MVGAQRRAPDLDGDRRQQMRGFLEHALNRAVPRRELLRTNIEGEVVELDDVVELAVDLVVLDAPQPNLNRPV
jgi:hypothetical protein